MHKLLKEWRGLGKEKEEKKLSMKSKQESIWIKVNFLMIDEKKLTKAFARSVKELLEQDLSINFGESFVF